MARIIIIISTLVIAWAPALHSAEVYWRGFDPKKFEISDEDFDIDLSTKGEKSFGEKEIYLEGVNPEAIGALGNPHDITTPPGETQPAQESVGVPFRRPPSIRETRPRPRPAAIPPPPTQRRLTRTSPTVKPAESGSESDDKPGPTVLEKKPEQKKLKWGRVELKPDQERKSKFKWGSNN